MKIRNNKKSIKHLLCIKGYVNKGKICAKHLWNYEKKRVKIKNRE